MFALVIAMIIASGVAATEHYATNHFLGTCLTESWANATAAALGLSPTARDAQGRRLHPFLAPALNRPRFAFLDPRTAAGAVGRELYDPALLPADAVLHGHGAVVDALTGAVLDPGSVNGSLVLELSGWTTHSLVTLVFSIVVAEAYGFPVAHYYVTDTLNLTQRMSSVGTGRTTPTHANLEVWVAGIEAALAVYANESFTAGGVGYFGRSGLYTTVDFIHAARNASTYGRPLYANFWQGYALDEELIRAVPVSGLRNGSAFFPPPLGPDGIVPCANDSQGCRNHCSRSQACTDREQRGGECLVVVMMYDYFDPGYLQAVLANNDVPAYFCFLGYDGAQAYALDAQRRGRPVLFYHFEPDLFHFTHPGLFDRVFLPRSTPERVALATGTFGERGFGLETTNPVDVDFPMTKLTKYAAGALHEDSLLLRLVTQFAISELDVHHLLRRYLNATTNNGSSDPVHPDPVFAAACEWVRDNYPTWSPWLERLPLCRLETHVTYDVAGCDALRTTGVRVITFSWRAPHPGNASAPLDCDGGLLALPPPIRTSRSCAWILEDPTRWAGWAGARPPCDASFYKYNISACDAHARRTVRYWWLLPDPTDPLRSLECDGGAALPTAVSVDCDYMPYSAGAFVAIASVDGLLVLGLLGAMALVFRHREAPIIKRAQYRQLLLMLTGGVLMGVAILLYAGEPTRFLCGARPVVISTAFTIIFGSLLVKSLRVYRVYMQSLQKRTGTTTSASSSAIAAHTGTSRRVFAVIASVDVLILLCWFIVDYPNPTIAIDRTAGFAGELEITVCQSSSFLFTALLFFWKAIVLFVGLYLSFLIRNVSTDFQESIWTFGSCVVVLVGCVVLMPLAYVVQLPATTFYTFFASVLLGCTTLVMVLMFVPKLLRFRAVGSASSDKSSNRSLVSIRPERHVMASRRSVQSGAEVSLEPSRGSGDLVQPGCPTSENSDLRRAIPTRR